MCDIFLMLNYIQAMALAIVVTATVVVVVVVVIIVVGRRLYVIES